MRYAESFECWALSW